MSQTIKALTATFGAFLLAITGNAEARGGHGHHHGGGGIGFYWGYPGALYSPFYSPFYSPYYYPYYAPQPIVNVPAQPPIYIERERPMQQPQQYPEGYWYYCASPEGYYPYVQQCPGGWRQVDPIPPQ